MFEEECEVMLEGEIYQIAEKEKSLAVYLKQITVTSLNRQDYSKKETGIRKILVYISKDETVYIKNRIAVTGTLCKFEKGTNPGQFNAYNYYKANGMDYQVFADTITLLDGTTSVYHEFLQSLRKKIFFVFQTLLPEEDSGIMSAMLLGEKNSIIETVKDLYEKNGISHILAISGLHISMIGMCFYQILKKIYCPNEIAIPLSIFLLFSYGTMTGFSVSTNRAVVMLAIMLIGILIGRTYDFISAIYFSGVVILVQNPRQIMNGGFLLSFGAVFAIAYVFPILKEIFLPDEVERTVYKTKTRRLNIDFLFFHPSIPKNLTESKRKKAIKKQVKKLIENMLLSISIQFVTIPILLYFYFDFPIYSFLLNLIILPLVSLLIGIGICTGFLGMTFLNPAYFLAGSLHFILLFYQIVCKFFLKLPGSIMTFGRPSFVQIILYYCFLVLFLILYTYSSKKIWLVLLLGCCCIFYRGERTELNITMLDIGQGDAILIESKSGKNYFIDGGSTSEKKIGEYRITPCLKSKGISTIDYAMVTHMDQDHISGLTELLEVCDTPGNIKIKHLIVPDTTLQDEAFLNMVSLATEKNVPVIYMKKGDKLVDEELSFTCFHPYEGFQTTERNDYSLVLHLQYYSFDMLFTGDVSNEGEEALIENPNLPQCDVLKVSHHGSGYTNSEELLEKLQPKIAIISAGKNNDYGHPNKETIDRLEAIGCQWFCTIDEGAIEVKTDGEGVRVE